MVKRKDPELRGVGLMILTRYSSVFITGFWCSDNEDNPEAKRCTHGCHTRIVLFSLRGGKWIQDACQKTRHSEIRACQMRFFQSCSSRSWNNFEKEALQSLVQSARTWQRTVPISTVKHRLRSSLVFNLFQQLSQDRERLFPATPPNFPHKISCSVFLLCSKFSMHPKILLFAFHEFNRMKGYASNVERF